MIDRILEKKIAQLKRGFPVIMITGPRQSGKTTIAKKCFPEYDYINLENPDERVFVINDPRAFFSRHRENGIIIDEVQRVPELFSFLQGEADAAESMGKIILTGSQNYLLMESITQSLAGRAAVLTLLPFSMDELSAYIESHTTDRLLHTGFYPPIFDRHLAPGDFHKQYVTTYIERDVRLIKNISDLNRFRDFLSLCAGRVGQLINFNALANETGVDAKTAKSWLSVLENSFVVFRLRPYHRNFNKRIVKQTKLYFHDTGLLCHLLRIRGPEQLPQFYLRGSLFENLIISEIYKYRLNTGEPPDLYFWRDHIGNEIDLIIDRGIDFTAIEIKSTQTFQKRLLASLTKFKKISGMSGAQFLIYDGTMEQEMSGISIVPWKQMGQYLSDYI